ncbi:hypothetical protein AVEN_248232-1, partial [Araneus ventricosus]
SPKVNNIADVKRSSVLSADVLGGRSGDIGAIVLFHWKALRERNYREMIPSTPVFVE